MSPTRHAVADQPASRAGWDDDLVFRLRGTRCDGQLIRVSSSKCSIGSDPRCTIRFHAPGVAPVHCLILRGPACTVVRRWAPGARLNGGPFLDAELLGGDRLGFGPIELEVCGTPTLRPHQRWSNPEPEPAAGGADRSFEGPQPVQDERLQDKHTATPAADNRAAASSDEASPELLARLQELERQLACAQQGGVRETAEFDLGMIREQADQLLAATRDRCSRLADGATPGEGQRQDGEHVAEAIPEELIEQLQQAESELQDTRAERDRLQQQVTELTVEMDGRLEENREALQQEQRRLQQQQVELQADRQEALNQLQQSHEELQQHEQGLTAERKRLNERQRQLELLQSDMDGQHQQWQLQRQQYEDRLAETLAELQHYRSAAQLDGRDGAVDQDAEGTESSGYTMPWSPESAQGLDAHPDADVNRPADTARLSVPPGEYPDEDPDESIEQYMANLLKRVHGRPAETASHGDTAPQTKKRGQETAARISPMDGATAKTSGSEREKTPAEPGVSPPDESQQASQFIPRHRAPESTNLQAMRELANHSARSAIQTSDRRRTDTFVRDKLILSLAAIVIGSLLSVISSGALSLTMLGGWAGFLVAGYWVYQVFHFRDRENPEEAADSAVEALPADGPAAPPLDQPVPDSAEAD